MDFQKVMATETKQAMEQETRALKSLLAEEMFLLSSTEDKDGLAEIADNVLSLIHDYLQATGKHMWAEGYNEGLTNPIEGRNLESEAELFSSKLKIGEQELSHRIRTLILDPLGLENNTDSTMREIERTVSTYLEEQFIILHRMGLYKGSQNAGSLFGGSAGLSSYILKAS